MTDSLTKKTVPSNTDAERQVLGAILTRSRAMDDVASVGLKPEDFYIPKHSQIFEAAIDLYAHKDAVDLTTVTSKVPDLKATVEDLVASSRDAENVATHAKIVKEFAQKRSILDVAQRLATMAHDKELSEVKSFAKDIVTKVLTTDDERRSLLSPADQIQLLLRMIQDRREGIDVGIPSGFKRMDKLTGGLRRGDLIVLGARTSVGKSSFAECVAENVARAGHPTLFVSVEMDPTQMAYRMAKRWGMSPSIIDMGSDDEDSRRSIEKFVEQRLATPLYIWNAPGASTVGIRAHLNQLQADIGPVDLVVIDYLQLLTDTFNNGKIAEHLRLGLITKTLKSMAREYEIPIILITQLNRNSDQRGVLPEPRLSDIRESGRIEEDSDLILFLWRTNDVNAYGSDTHLKIAKNRQGPLGEVPMIFNKPYFYFVEPSDRRLAEALAQQKDEDDLAGLYRPDREDEDAFSDRPGDGANPETYEEDEGYQAEDMGTGWNRTPPKGWEEAEESGD